MSKERIVFIKRKDGTETEHRMLETVSDIDAINVYEEVTGLRPGQGDIIYVGSVPEPEKHMEMTLDLDALHFTGMELGLRVLFSMWRSCYPEVRRLSILDIEGRSLDKVYEAITKMPELDAHLLPDMDVISLKWKG